MKTITLTMTGLLLLSTLFAIAQPGSPDSSFSKDGKVKSFIDDGTGHGSYGDAAALQQDGKLVVAGTGENHYVLMRYKTNGVLDKSFGVNGVVMNQFQVNTSPVIFAVAIQANGKIIVAGESGSGSDANCAFARYDVNGSIDSSFGTEGNLIIDFTKGDYDHASGLAVQPDGKIVASVVALNGTNYNFAALRLNRNGTLDNSFGVKGKVTTDFSPTTGETSNAITLQPDGKIILSGTISNDSLQNFALARYNPNGSLDSNFGINGKVTTDFNNNLDDVATVAIKTDGKIVVAGDTYNGSNYDFALAQYRPNGTPDMNFGTNGKVTTDFSNGSNEEIFSIVIQADNKIIAAGMSNSVFALAMYRLNGTLDQGFGSHGKVTTDFFDTECDGRSVLLQSDGKILVAGYSYKYVYPHSFAKAWIAIARYNGDGLLADDNISASMISDHSIVLSVYPNPVQSVLNVQFSNLFSSGKTVSIYDMNGKLLFTKPAESNTRLDMKRLVSGAYLLKIRDADGKILYDSKIIKQ
jgi:uncharacterized delta-60 repeat protein